MTDNFESIFYTKETGTVNLEKSRDTNFLEQIHDFESSNWRMQN